jgi:glycosyltransferase involved in cell wall biosynthesis
MVHNRYLQGGGEDECADAEARLLESRGHEVVTLLEDNSRVAQLGALRAATKTLWSSEAYRRVRQVLAVSQYDVVSVHNFFPLFSPAVYYAARAQDVPVVQTLHNYRLLCPNGLLYRDRRVCEDCLGHSVPAPALLHRCYRGSLPATSTVAGMLAVHRLARTWTNMVDQYVALTEFMRKKCIEGGLPAAKITVKPNFVWPDPGQGAGDGAFALFVGRLTEEKGIITLLDAWKRVGSACKLWIVGDGPLEGLVESAAETYPSVVWLNRRSWAEVLGLLGRANFLVMPSGCYEAFGRVVIEAYAKGTPVVGSNLGAMSELISPGRTGLLFRAGDPLDLASAVNWMVERPEEMKRMRAEARLEYEAKYTGERNGILLEEIFDNARRVAAARPRWSGGR